MKTEKELLEKFEVEELEQRYEMAWVDQAKVGATYDGFGGSVTIPLHD